MSRSSPSRVLAICLWSSLLSAQQPAPPAPAIALPTGVTSPVLAEFGGEPWGTGATYKTRFDEAGPEFVPRYGVAAPHDTPVRYELVAIGRGGQLAPVGRATRVVDGLRVDYRRADLVERYDVRLDGLEQSFLLHELPGGDGDLVLRAGLTTGMQVAPHAGGLQFTLPGVGSCTLGAVTAIDAKGRRITGAMRCHDGLVDYIVPAEFVATATLPLLIDPLFGSITTVASASVGEQNADVAFDATNGVYLVVYEYLYSATDTDIYALRVGTDGVPIGTATIVEGSGANDLAPQVANVAVRDRFVVVWNRQVAGEGDVQARTVAATTGLGPVVAVASGTASQGSADVGGEATTASAHAICVWHNSTAAAIEAAQLEVNADGTLLVQDVTTIVTGTASEPRLAKSGGTTGRQLIVWRRNYGLGDFDPEGMVVDRELTRLALGISFDAGINFISNVDVDGDGENWVAAWQTRESITVQFDVFARSVHFVGPNGYALGSGIATIEATAATDETRPRVCWTGDATLIAYQIAGTPGVGATYVRSIDSISCANCEGRSRFVTSLSDDYGIAGASRRSGGDTVDEALFVQELRTGGVADLRAQRWAGNDGISQVVAQGCGSKGGTTYASCARAGHAGFAVRCVDAEPDTTAILVLSRDQGMFPCGPCRLVPDPFRGYLHATTTDSSGAAGFAAAIPASATALGIAFHLQWVVVEPITPGCYVFGSDLSNALRTTIE